MKTTSLHFAALLFAALAFDLPASAQEKSESKVETLDIKTTTFEGSVASPENNVNYQSKSMLLLKATNVESGKQVSIFSPERITFAQGFKVEKGAHFYASVKTAARSSTTTPEQSVPTEFKLLQNYPNPFNPSTQIAYALPRAADVDLRVYDMLGRQVAVLVQTKQSAGNYSVSFNAGMLASGAYFYRLNAGGNVASKKMMLVK
jgi:Secretion system C-terminal sorting domain